METSTKLTHNWHKIEGKKILTNTILFTDCISMEVQGRSHAFKFEDISRLLSLT